MGRAAWAAGAWRSGGREQGGEGPGDGGSGGGGGNHPLMFSSTLHLIRVCGSTGTRCWGREAQRLP